jgi:ATP phosphoribosyltransferase regulatory subunit
MSQLGASTAIPAVGFSVWIETLTQVGRRPAASGLSGSAT